MDLELKGKYVEMALKRYGKIGKHDTRWARIPVIKSNVITPLKVYQNIRTICLKCKITPLIYGVNKHPQLCTPFICGHL